MAVAADATTFQLPNYVGDLFSITPTDTPFLAAIGGLTGGDEAKSTKFGWQYHTNRAGATDRQRLEGADAVVQANRKRQYAYNVVEIHQEAIEVSYTKQAAVDLIGAVGDAARDMGSGSNPVTNEFEWQIEQELKSIALDVENTFISGTYADPADNTAPRKTRGLLEAVATNVVTADGTTGTGTSPGDLSIALLDDAMQAAFDSGGLGEDAEATLMLGATQRRKLTAAAKAEGLEAPRDRTVAGVAVQTIWTNFGRLNVMLNRHMPADQVAVVTLAECAPVLLKIPGKGFLFVEPLSKSGASEKAQIYGEIGLKYGDERKHAKVVNLTV